MTNDIDEMEKMLNDYLQFAKTQSYEETSEINLTSLINNLKKEISDNNFSLNLGDDIIFINGRKNSIKRCLLNLIQNGLTYGEKVTISHNKTGNRVFIIVEDNGLGIPQEQFKNVFKPFFRIDKSRSLNKSGIGLGLAIVEDIVNSHGGNISLSKSKSMGGLQVKISLPY